MKIGDIEFEIEAQPDQIQTAVDKILATVTERLKNTNLAQVAERPAPPPEQKHAKASSKNSGKKTGSPNQEA